MIPVRIDVVLFAGKDGEDEEIAFLCRSPHLDEITSLIRQAALA
jgi:hypothetical protein